MFPILFKLPLPGREVPFYSYGFLLGVALFVAMELCVHLSEGLGIPRKRVYVFGVIVIAAGYIGSHLHAFVTDPNLPGGVAGLLSGKGFTFYGASISGTLAAFPAARFLKIPLWRILEASAPTVPIAHGIGRLGCFLYGCCYGIRVSPENPVGVCFPSKSPCHVAQVREGVIAEAAPRALPVFPVQLVEVVFELALGLTLVLAVKRRWFRREATVLFVYFLCYGPLRIFTETLRGDAVNRGKLLGLSTSTTIGISTVVIALAFLFIPPLVRLRAIRPEEPSFDSDPSGPRSG